MTDDAVPELARELIHEAMSSMDHVEVLLTLHNRPASDCDQRALVEATRIAPAIVQRVLDDLVAAGLVSRDEKGYRFSASSQDRAAVVELAALYHSRPVTLVRAIYARPSSISPLSKVLRSRPQPDS